MNSKSLSNGDSNKLPTNCIKSCSVEFNRASKKFKRSGKFIKHGRKSNMGKKKQNLNKVTSVDFNVVREEVESIEEALKDYINPLWTARKLEVKREVNSSYT